MNPQKLVLYRVGIERASAVLDASGLPLPGFMNATSRERGGRGYGHYEPVTQTIVVNVTRTVLPPKTPGYSWSYPGYKADLTAFGVTCHEAGHHTDFLLPDRRARLREVRIVRETEPCVTRYEPNLAEVLAEAFKLFCTNPDLLRAGRPRRFGMLVGWGLVPVEDRAWQEVLTDAHPKIIRAAENWIACGN